MYNFSWIMLETYLRGASAWDSGTVSVLCQERFWAEVDLKRRYTNGRNEWMNESGYRTFTHKT